MFTDTDLPSAEATYRRELASTDITGADRDSYTTSLRTVTDEQARRASAEAVNAGPEVLSELAAHWPTASMPELLARVEKLISHRGRL